MEHSVNTIHVSSYGIFSASDLAPLADDLSQRHMFVGVSVSRFTPPAAGWSEIALYLSPVGVAAGAYAAGFIASWAAEDAKALRAKLLDLIRRGRTDESGRQFLPMCLMIGRVRFYFHEPLTDVKFVERLEEARKYVLSLPAIAFENEPGPGEYGHVWDTETQSWKGQVYGVSEGEFINIYQYMDVTD